MTFEQWWDLTGRFIDPDFSDVPWFDKREGLAAAAFDAASEGLRPEHKCRKIATAIMAEGRDWWVGELLEPVSGHEIETHCLHMLTPLKDIVFLVNDADFQWLTVLGQASCGPINQEWLERVTSGSMKRASDEDRQ